MVLKKNTRRMVTASSLFDGHDAAINMYRRLFQQAGYEVIHIGHNRSVEQIVRSAIQEDANAICISSYQGGHMEFFRYLYDQLKAQKAGDVAIIGGGGGTILPSEIVALEAYGISKLYHPEDGRKMGLEGILADVNRRIKSVHREIEFYEQMIKKVDAESPLSTFDLSKGITLLEEEVNAEKAQELSQLLHKKKPQNTVVLGITGPGGAGKSSLVDELLNRYLHTCSEGRVGVLAFDPTKKKTGGAFLGDRIRMNSVYHDRVFLRSMATRGSSHEIGKTVKKTLALMQYGNFDLIILETTGIGQGDAGVVDCADVTLYVMTSEYGASSQLEKIDMIDYADAIVVNKFDKLGAEDTFNDVAHAYAYSRKMKFTEECRDSLPIFGTIASNFNNQGVSDLYIFIVDLLSKKSYVGAPIDLKRIEELHHPKQFATIPPEKTFYLGELAQTVRDYKAETREKENLASKLYHLSMLKDENHKDSAWNKTLEQRMSPLEEELGEEARQSIEAYHHLKKQYAEEDLVYTVRNKEIRKTLFFESLSNTRIPKVIVPLLRDWGDILRYMRLENVPGAYPYTAGVFPLKSDVEDPKRQFAGEGPPQRTNKRFHYLSKNDTAKRLSTAFDSVTLYGEDPSERPDIYGKVGNSGVSIASLDDMKALFKGFDLSSPTTSVSLTINGPAPMILAMFLNAAIDFEVEKVTGKKREDVLIKTYEKIRLETLKKVRGTVQADILKEEQAQNTCIFSSKFALKMMGDIQEYFIKKSVKNFYSVSISGYHIAEAGANPISQLAFTLANGFTYVEYYLSRGLHIDQIAPNLSFFFSSGLDPEYAVIGRVARRIWAVTMREKYGANERSCKLKYHIQTSGRSLHAQEIAFNDIRTTLQALMAIYDNCNSLHTNAYDEAITTPTEESVRRAMAIQLILTKEYGVAKCQNAMQGSYFYELLTDLVEESVLEEFDSISRRGGVLGAMEKQYQRHRIQTESMKYELQKSTGELPIIGVNTYMNENFETDYENIEVVRASEEEKSSQIHSVRAFILRAGKKNQLALDNLEKAALSGENIFAELMETVKYASLGQMTHLLYECGGEYRRSM